MVLFVKRKLALGDNIREERPIVISRNIKLNVLLTRVTSDKVKAYLLQRHIFYPVLYTKQICLYFQPKSNILAAVKVTSEVIRR